MSTKKYFVKRIEGVLLVVVFPMILGALLTSSVGAASAESDDKPVKESTPVEESNSIGESNSTEGPTQPPTSNKQVERIEVTGSHIKRVDVEGTQPIQTLDREYLEQTGYNSVADVLREISANSFGSLREQSGSDAAGVAHVSLRGLGSTRTLILMNGNRLARDGVTGAPDLNLIPMSAVERVEILKDSSAATYGSDAVGGVVNVITKKDFIGSEVSVRQEISDDEGGNKRTISGTYGWGNRKGNAVVSMQYRDNDLIYSRDREWSKVGASTHSPSPNVRPVGGELAPANKNCDSPQTVYNDTHKACMFNYAAYSSELPAIRQYNMLGNFRYQLTPSTELTALLKGTRKETNWRYAPGAIRITQGDPGVEELIIDGTSYEQIRWRSLSFGTRDTEVKTDALGASVNLKKYMESMPFGSNWEMDAILSFEQVKRKNNSVRGYAKKANFLKAIQDSSASGCDILNNNCPYSDEFGYAPWELTRSQVNSSELRLTGDLWEMEAGPVAMAVGMQANSEGYSDTYDALSLEEGVIGGGSSSQGKGSRQTLALYNEYALPLSENWNVQVSGRFDHYSDFGSTFNPQISASWRTSPSLLVRASAGTGFKAPDLNDLHKEPGESAAYFVDEIACRAGWEAQGGTGDTPAFCRTYEYLVFVKGNKDLKEEKSRSFNLGMVFAPSKSLSMGLDAFAVNMENTIGLDYQLLTEAEAAGVDLSRYNTEVQRSNGVISEIHTTRQNLSETQLQGVDFTMTFRKFFNRVGDFTFYTDTSYLLNYKRRGFPGTSLRSMLQRAGYPRWRNTVSLEYVPAFANNWRTLLSANTIGSHKKPAPTDGDHDRYTTLDFQFSYALDRVLRGGKISFGVRNLLAGKPPTDDDNDFMKHNSSLYDNIGRRFFMTYRQTF